MYIIGMCLGNHIRSIYFANIDTKSYSDLLIITH